MCSLSPQLPYYAGTIVIVSLHEEDVSVSDDGIPHRARPGPRSKPMAVPSMLVNVYFDEQAVIPTLVGSSLNAWRIPNNFPAHWWNSTSTSQTPLRHNCTAERIPEYKWSFIQTPFLSTLLFKAIPGRPNHPRRSKVCLDSRGGALPPSWIRLRAQQSITAAGTIADAVLYNQAIWWHQVGEHTAGHWVSIRAFWFIGTEGEDIGKWQL